MLPNIILEPVPVLVAYPDAGVTEAVGDTFELRAAHPDDFQPSADVSGYHMIVVAHEFDALDQDSIT